MALPDRLRSVTFTRSRSTAPVQLHARSTSTTLPLSGNAAATRTVLPAVDTVPPPAPTEPPEEEVVMPEVTPAVISATPTAKRSATGASPRGRPPDAVAARVVPLTGSWGFLARLKRLLLSLAVCGHERQASRKHARWAVRSL